jgi:uncharacterized protein YqgC (DUF456 family)
MDLALLVVGVVLVVVGVATVALPGVPGAAIAYLGILLVAWADEFARIGSTVLLALAVVAVVGSLVDNVTGPWALRRRRLKLAGALLGAVAGLAFGPGLVLGPFVGAVALKNPDLNRAWRAGLGTFLGLLAGAVLKSAATLLMVGVAVLAYFF